MKYYPFLILLFILIGCKNNESIIHKSTDGSEKKYSNWFAKYENFNKPEFKEKFISTFNKALTEKNFSQTSELLISVFDLMSEKFGYDSVYVELLKNYIEKHEDHIFIDDVFLLNRYYGEYEHFNTNYKKCIEIFQRITRLKPYNYSTYSEQGHAYYYISSSFYYLGDLDKSLEEIEKAILCFNKTDNEFGHALVQHMKATLNYDTKNIQEAIKDINKTINIYERLNYPEGLISAMFNKYEFLFKVDSSKSIFYFDTIKSYINSGKVIDEQSLIHFSVIEIEKNITEKNISALDKLIPKLEIQSKKLNYQYWNYIVEYYKSRYQLLKYHRILNKKSLLKTLDFYKKNKDIIYPVSILQTLKEEALANKDMIKIIEYDNELDEYEKKIQAKDFQYKVNTFEKKLENAKKEKIISEQKNKLSKSYFYLGLLGFIILTIIILLRIVDIKRKRNKAIEDMKRQEQFTFQLLQNTEEERSRIANELHDSVSHELLTVKNNLTLGRPIEAIDITNIIKEVRNISRNLHPAVLGAVGLEAAIETLCDRLTEIGLFTSCEIDYSQKMHKNKELQIFRIIQEALNNTLKHGKANAAKVILTSQNKYLHLEVKDNGNGFDVNEQLNNPKSFGLQSIMQRAKAIAAKIDITSNNLGTKIFLKIPN